MSPDLVGANLWGFAPHSLDTIEDCIHLAAVAHRDQKDKAGEPYILHPIRVMQVFSTNIERAVAVLHDIVEDSNQIGRAVKIADIMDNLTRLHRLPSIVEAQRLAVRYHKALKVLGVEGP